MPRLQACSSLLPRILTWPSVLKYPFQSFILFVGNAISVPKRLILVTDTLSVFDTPFMAQQSLKFIIRISRLINFMLVLRFNT